MLKRVRKIFKYLYRGFAFLLLLSVVFIAGFYVYLQSTPGERWLKGKLESTLQSTLKLPVHIGGANISFPGNVNLSDVTIIDHKGNKMFDIKYLRASISYYNFITQRLTLGLVDIDGLDFNLTSYDKEKNSNFGMVLDRLTASTGKPGTGPDVSIYVNSIRLKHVNFNWENIGEHYDPAQMDFDHIKVSNLSGYFTDLFINDPDFSVIVHNLSLDERTGFHLNDMHTAFKLDKHNMEFKNLYVKTPYTELRDYLKFSYDDIEQFGNFIDSIQITSHLAQSNISLKDISYFTAELKNKQDPARLKNVDVTGTISNLTLKNLDLAFGKESYFRGQGTLRGLPNIDETFIIANVTHAHTDREELNTILPEADLPEQVKSLGMVDFKGNFTGFYYDFVTYGDFNTALGRLVTDLNLKLSDKAENTQYSGKLSTPGFNLRAFTGEPELGMVAMNGSVKGSGLTLEALHTKINADFSRLDFHQYAYKGMHVNGDVTNSLFTGALNIDDPNAKFGFNGTIDYSKPKPEFKFKADVDHVNLAQLHFSDDTLSLSSKINIDAKGITLDDVEGFMTANGTKIITPAYTYNLDSINLVSIIRTHYRELNVYTDFLLGQLKGDFQLSQLNNSWRTLVNKYIDSNFTKGKVTGNQVVDFNISVQEINPLLNILKLPLSIRKESFISGGFSTANGNLKLAANIPDISYQKYNFKNIIIKGNSDKAYKLLNMDLNIGSMGINDTALIKNFKLATIIGKHNIKFNLHASDSTNSKEANLNGSLDIFKKYAFLKLDSSTLKLEKKTWDLSSEQITINGDSLINVPLLTIANGVQTLKLTGKYATKTSFPIRMLMENMEVSTLADFVPELKDMGGRIQGQMTVNDIHKNPSLDAGLVVQYLAYKKDTMGDLRIYTEYVPGQKKITVDGVLQDKYQNNIINALGWVSTDKGQKMDMDLALNKTKINIFQPFLEDILSNLKGDVSAQLKLTGSLKEPIMKGSISFPNDTLTVPYLNTTYNFSHNLEVNGRTIDIKNLKAYDVYHHLGSGNSSTATINGYFDLHSIDNINMSLGINADSMLLMNTTIKDNSDYYGHLMGSGYADIYGTFDNLNMVVTATTKKNSTFFLPIGQSNTFLEHDFIQITDKVNYGKHNKSLKTKSSSLNLTLNLHATPAATAQIIFDPKIGDVIEGRGYGDLSIELNTAGDFSLRGSYVIDTGFYRFTAYHVVNKSFIINKGSTISWTGDP